MGDDDKWPLNGELLSYVNIMFKQNLLNFPTLFYYWFHEETVELVPKELNHLAAILHVYAGGLNFMK